MCMYCPFGIFICIVAFESLDICLVICMGMTFLVLVIHIVLGYSFFCLFYFHAWIILPRSKKKNLLAIFLLGVSAAWGNVLAGVSDSWVFVH
jgi:hypothetical protein